MNGNQQANQKKALEELVKEVHEHQSTKQTQIDADEDHGADDQQAVDVLSLPPRKDIHQDRKRRATFKLRKPQRRLLIVILIIVGVIIGLYYVLGKDLIQALFFS